MGDCYLCGQPAGLFRKQHRECLNKHQTGKATMVDVVKMAILEDIGPETLKSELTDIARESHVPVTSISDYLLAGWEAAVEHFLDDGELDRAEEARIGAFVDNFELSREALDRNGAWLRLVEAVVIRDLIEGKVPERIRLDSQHPFNFQKSEKLIWVFTEVEYLEDKTKTEYRGGSHGLSLRIMKGVYYRVGAFKGQPVSRTERIAIDTGVLAVTTKHIYFSGPRKSFRIRHEKIVSIRPFTDGVAIVRDAATAKPQVFVTGDGWFINNLLANIPQLEL